ncbi:MAG: Ku protein, partial [Pseudonocardiaceae bacterium]
IIIQTMLWPNEVREPSFEVLSMDVELRPEEKRMAEVLVKSLTSDFKPDSFTDRYTEAVTELIASKAADPAATRLTTPEPATSGSAPAANLVDALRASVERAKADRTG